MKKAVLASLAAALTLSLPALVQTAYAQTTAPAAKMSAEQAREENAYAVGLQGYLWGFPLRYYGSVVPETLKVGLDSYNQKLQKNPDGTVDLYFAPKPPTGQESNWVTTTDGKPFFVIFRIYGLQKPIADKSWVLNDIERVN